MASVYIDDKFIEQNGNINCIVFKICYMRRAKSLSRIIHFLIHSIPVLLNISLHSDSN